MQPQIQALYVIALLFLVGFVVAGAMMQHSGQRLAQHRGQRLAQHHTRQVVAYAMLAALFLLAGWCAADGIKSQWVRLFDVFIYGPVLMWAGWKLRDTMPVLAPLLLFFGATTLSYNARNFVLLEGWMTAGGDR